ncbi:hypothetical protein NPX13_g9806 [Xylaria arbuscula]|uniref:Uncharacterized protein n=1 Tax=Xylaria arbuscula TaxID=114810 RepID=A0A9W8N600_9PEZI|nr:hypothetical protein NPX13_g9806 [Xylaria arbuscula]
MLRMSVDEHLLKEAEFGKLPFDIFALEKWDYSQPLEQDQEQWNRLAREWLNLDARGRHSLTPVATPTIDEINRVFVPHQTVRERNLSTKARMAHQSPVWLRTCYSPELASVYKGWVNSELDYVSRRGTQVLDDEALYAPFADDWSCVLLRVPAIADAVHYVFEDDGNLWNPREYFDPPGKGEEFMMPFYEAMVEEKTLLFLIDEEALRDKLVKILWLDIHGTCVWDNRLSPDQVLAFTGRMFDGASLAALYEEFPADPKLYKRSRILQID